MNGRMYYSEMQPMQLQGAVRFDFLRRYQHSVSIYQYTLRTDKLRRGVYICSETAVFCLTASRECAKNASLFFFFNVCCLSRRNAENLALNGRSLKFLIFRFKQAVTQDARSMKKTFPQMPACKKLLLFFCFSLAKMRAICAMSLYKRKRKEK